MIRSRRWHSFPTPPTNMESVPQRTMYGPEGVASGYFVSWEPRADEAGSSGSGEEAQMFPTLVDLLLCHGGTTEFMENILRLVKEHAKEELPDWGTQKLHLLGLALLELMLLEMDDCMEVEKWEHMEELQLWLKHAMALSVDIISKDLA